MPNPAAGEESQQGDEPVGGPQPPAVPMATPVNLEDMKQMLEVRFRCTQQPYNHMIRLTGAD